MIPTPETGWHWKITPEQVKAIKANDREAINAAYFDNYQKFAKIGYNFCRRVHDYNDREDFLQQVYVDMPKFDYTNTQTFYLSLCRCFKRLRNYISKNVSFDAELTDEDGYTLGDKMADENDLAESVERAEIARETATEMFNLLREMLRGKNKEKKFGAEEERGLREMLEYIFVGYTYEQIRQCVRG